jgi:regulator of replication initiation timing
MKEQMNQIHEFEQHVESLENEIIDLKEQTKNKVEELNSKVT